MNNGKSIQFVPSKESEDGFPLGSGSTLSKVYELKPLLSNNKDKWGLGKEATRWEDLLTDTTPALQRWTGS